MKTVKVLSVFLGLALFLSGFPMTAKAQRLQTQTRSRVQRTGHWEQWGSIDGPHSLYTKQMTIDVQASLALREFQDHVDKGLPPPPRGTDYRPRGTGPFDEAYLDRTLDEYTSITPEKGEVWLGMKNALPMYHNSDDRGYGPVPSYRYGRIWGLAEDDPQFYGGYEEVGIKACRNILPVVWIWIWDSPKPEPQVTPATPEKKCCEPQTPVRTAKAGEWRDGTYWEEWTDTCHNFWIEGCPPDAMLMVFEYGLSGKLTKNKGRKIRDMVDNRTGQKLTPGEVQFLVETIENENLDKKKLNYVRIDRIVCGPGKGALVVRYFYDGDKLRWFLIGLGVGLLVGVFVGAHFFAKACPPGLFDKFYSGTGNAPIPPPN